MKNLIYIIAFILISKSVCLAQLPQDYPFKTYMDETGNLYFTGVENGDIFTFKYPPINPVYNFPLWTIPFVNPGYDRGYDIAIDSGSVYVTGHVTGEKYSNDLILIKYNSTSGAIVWTRKFGGMYDDKAYGVAVDAENNVYITGYKSDKYNNKNLVTLKYDYSGNLIFQHEYDNEKYHGNDAGTDILTDRGHVYVAGYTYQGTKALNDILMLTYDKDNLTVTDSNIYRKDFSNEVPTSFVLTDISLNRIAKSRSAISSITDIAGIPNSSDFMTICFEGGSFNRIAWSKLFNGSGNGNDVATDLTSDGKGSVYVTGYSNRSAANVYDFATIKYNNATGEYGWNDTVKYFNYGTGSGEDKASSVKIRNNKIYVSGTSQAAPNGIYTVIYEQNNGVITNTWDRVFYPSFTKSDTYESMNKASKLEIDSSGNLIVIAFAWNASVAKYAAIKYDSLGNVLFTLDENVSDNKGDSQISDHVKTEQFNLKQNFPNPFNPVTNINYELTVTNNVQLIVYDILGNEVSTLVNENQNPGSYSVSFEGSNRPSGIYFYKLIVNGYVVDTKRMILLK